MFFCWYFILCVSLFFCFKQKTAYEVRISDWSSDVCSSDLGDEAAIREFCSLTYDVDFPMFSKVDVNGDGAHPLWKWLKKEKGGLLGIDAIKWNFSKFL